MCSILNKLLQILWGMYAINNKFNLKTIPLNREDINHISWRLCSKNLSDDHSFLQLSLLKCAENAHIFDRSSYTPNYLKHVQRAALPSSWRGWAHADSGGTYMQDTTQGVSVKRGSCHQTILFKSTSGPPIKKESSIILERVWKSQVRFFMCVQSFREWPMERTSNSVRRRCAKLLKCGWEHICILKAVFLFCFGINRKELH